MTAATSLHRVGVLGAGRLGKALALRLRELCTVSVYDQDIKKAKQFTKQNGLSFRYEEELIAQSDHVFLCLPTAAIRDVLHRAAARQQVGPAWINLATTLDTRELLAVPALRSLRIVGLKPLAQFKLIELGMPTLFVTSTEDRTALAALRELLLPIGRVIAGDESRVGPFNREVTRQALRFCRELEAAMQPLAADREWRAAGLRSLAAGTLMDYPPSPDNEYTASLLRELDLGTGRAPGASS